MQGGSLLSIGGSQAVSWAFGERVPSVFVRGRDGILRTSALLSP